MEILKESMEDLSLKGTSEGISFGISGRISKGNVAKICESVLEEFLR